MVHRCYVRWTSLYKVRAIAVFPVFRLLTYFVCLLTYEFCLSPWKITRCSVILLLPLFRAEPTSGSTVTEQYIIYLHSHTRVTSVHNHASTVKSYQEMTRRVFFSIFFLSYRRYILVLYSKDLYHLSISPCPLEI